MTEAKNIDPSISAGHETPLRAADKIVATELPGILNRLLPALQRLHLRGAFGEPEECLRARLELLACANPLRGFLEERCVEREGAVTPLKRLYEAFQLWCKEQGQAVPFTLRSMKSRLESIGYVVRKSNVAVVDGLALT